MMPYYLKRSLNVKITRKYQVLSAMLWNLRLANFKANVFKFVEKKNQLDVTECFIAFTIRSTCFGHFYAHHQELETICVLLPPMVCNAWLLVVGGQVQAGGHVSRKRDVARLSR